MNELEEKIYNGEHLTEQELMDAAECCEEVCTTYGENRRWTRSARTIIKVKDKLFCIEWEQGLTEIQENEYYNQPYEVEEKTRVIEKKYYVRKEK